MSYIVILMSFTAISPSIGHDTEAEACFKRRASLVPNGSKTIDNQLKCLIIYCF
jgi:hypothetical protein